MKIVLQVYPKISNKEPNESSYIYESKQIKARLPGEAVYKQLSENDKSELILILPKSLIEERENASKISNQLIIVQSIGRYGGKEYKGDYRQMIATVFSELVKKSLQVEKEGESIDEIVVDISRGQNIYVTMLIEAVRNFVVFYKMKNWGRNREMSEFKWYISFSEPVEGQVEGDIRISKVDFSQTVFFDLPIKKLTNDNGYKNELINKLLLKFFKDVVNYNQLKKIVYLTVFLFNSIKNAIVLPLFYVDFPTSREVEDLIEKFASRFIELNERENYNKIEKFDAKLYIQFIQSLGLFVGLMKNIEESGIKLSPEDEGFVEVEKLENFKEILDKSVTNIAARFFEREINYLKSINIEEGKTVKLSDIRKSERLEQNKTSFGEFQKGSDQKRNFFAHAGFEESIVEIQKKSGKLYVRYTQQKIEELKENKGDIYKWILDSK